MNQMVRLNRQQEVALQKVADDFVEKHDGDVMKALKSMIVFNGHMQEQRGAKGIPLKDHRPNSAHKLTGVQIGESEQEGQPVGILTLGTLAGPFDFIITDKAAEVIIEAMTTAQAAMHGQRQTSRDRMGIQRP